MTTIIGCRSEDTKDDEAETKAPAERPYPVLAPVRLGLYFETGGIEMVFDNPYD